MTLRDVIDLFKQYADNETETDIGVIFNEVRADRAAKRLSSGFRA